MRKITLIPGDGIGPEICASMTDIFSAAKIPVEWETVDCGLTQFEKTGVLVPDTLKTSLLKNQVGIKGPTTTPVGGGHRSINVTMRQDYDMYANVRPVLSIPGIESLHSNVDMMIVRENTEDLYRGVEYRVDADTVHGLKIITRKACRRIARYAFELAKRHQRKKVTAVHKANIMKLTDGLFLECVHEIAKEYPEIECNDIIVDNCCMQMVTKPQQFDVIVTENLYGDIISDLASGLVGGLGVASGANIGENVAVFEAVHGSAPDIAGKDLANPSALILSSILMLEHLKMSQEAKRVKRALEKTLSQPATRTKDLKGPLGTKAFTQAIIANL